MMTWFVVFGLFLSLSGQICTICNAGKAPNILLILTDDMGYADASFSYGLNYPIEDAPIPTPNIDKLAHNGIIFSNHYTHCICAFSRTALLTSRFAYHLGNPFPSGIDPRGGGDLPSGYVTFAHELKKRGYMNHLIGKYGIDWHGRYWDWNEQRWTPAIDSNNVKINGLGPMARGFDTFFGTYGSTINHYSKKFNNIIDWHRFNSTHFLDSPNDDSIDFNSEPDTITTDIFVRETKNVINNHDNAYDSDSDNPWFIYLSFTAPHFPLMIDENKYLNASNYPHCANKANHRRALFCGMMANVDDGIGEIMQLLDDKNLLERDTIIIFSSDNGGMPYMGGYNYPYRGGKFGAFEGSDKTAAFIYAPHIFQNTSKHVFDGMIHIVDWVPTLLSLVDQEINGIGSESETDSDNSDNSDICTECGCGVGSRVVPNLKHTMGDIDGRDYSHVLKTFVDGSNKYNNIYNSVYNNTVRTELILEMNGWGNVTGYIWNDYKLTYGFANMDAMVSEPNDECTFNSDMRKGKLDCLPDWIGLFMDNVFGVDYYAYEYLLLTVLGKVNDNGPKYGKSYTVSANRHPHGLPDLSYYYDQYSNIDNNNNSNSNNNIYDENGFIDVNTNNVNLRPLWIPSVNWDDLYERGKIRLYNLKNDKSETNNIALENREIVDAMIARIVDDISKYKHVKSLCFGFHVQVSLLENKMNEFIKQFAIAFLVFNILVIYLIYKFCNCCNCYNCCKSVTKAKQE